MAVKIRLQRRGRKKKPFYHIVVADARAPRDGRFIEKLGIYNPMSAPATIELDGDRTLDWLMKGAQPTDTARAILRFKGVMYKKHLLRGVKKGALSQEDADKLFDQWIAEKDAKVAKRVEETKTKVEKTRATIFGSIQAYVEKPAEAPEPIASEEGKEEVVEEAKEASAEKVEEVKEAVTEKVEETAKVAEEVKEAAAEKAEKATEVVKEVKEAAAEKVEETAKVVKEVKEAAGEKVEETVEKVEEVKEAIAEKVEETTEKVEEVKEAAAEKVEKATEVVEEVKEAAAEKVEKTAKVVEEVKEAAVEKVEDAAETASETVEEVVVEAKKSDPETEEEK